MHDTFERVAVIRPQSEVDRNLNYAVAAVVLVHNLDFAYPLDPYPCRNIHGLAKAVNKQNEKDSQMNSIRFYHSLVGVEQKRKKNMCD